MTTTFVLVHSPSVGPSSWTPVASALDRRGFHTCVPSLLGVAAHGPPFDVPVLDRVVSAVAQLPADAEVILVAHSNAGVFMPLLVEAVPRPVRSCIFVDAVVPPPTGALPVASEEMLEFLRPMAVDGWLPQWTQWWDAADVEVLFPDAETRVAFVAEEPRLPLSYYEQTITVPSGWDERFCAYLIFGAAYHDMAADARRRGWPVVELAGEHLHQIVDPEGVARQLQVWAADSSTSAGDLTVDS